MNQRKRDSAVWSTPLEIHNGLHSRSTEFTREKRQVRIMHKSGRVMIGHLTSVTNDSGQLSFKPVGGTASENMNFGDISQFTVLEKPFGTTSLTENRSRWM